MFLSRHRGTKPWMVTMEWWMYVRRMNENQNGWNGKTGTPFQETNTSWIARMIYHGNDPHPLKRFLDQSGNPHILSKHLLFGDSQNDPAQKPVVCCRIRPTWGFRVFFFHGVSGWERDLKIVLMAIWYNMVPISETSIILRTFSSNWLWGSVIFKTRSRVPKPIWIISASHKAQTSAFNTRPDTDGFPKISNLGLAQKSQTLELWWWKHVYHIQM